MPLDLLKMLPGTLPRLFDSAAEVQKVSKLVFAELVEAEFVDFHLEVTQLAV